jgi:hypothetical protein
MALLVIPYLSYFFRRRRLAQMGKQRDAQAVYASLVSRLAPFPEAKIRQVYEALQGLIDYPLPILPEEDLLDDLDADMGNLYDWLETLAEKKGLPLSSVDNLPTKAADLIRFVLEKELV